MALLALSRPYEGLVASIPVVCILSADLFRSLRSPHAGTWRLVFECGFPLLITLTALAGFIAAHNHAITGNAFKLPYVEYFEQYESAPPFLFQSPRPEPSYNHPIQRKFFRGVARDHRQRRSPSGFLRACGEKFRLYNNFFLGWAFAIVGLGVLLVLSERKVRFSLACMVLFALGTCAETFDYPHYAAPFVPIGAYLWVRALQALWEVRGGLPAVRIAVALLVVAGIVLQASQANRDANYRASFKIYKRGEIIDWLEARDGDHLVVVRYGAKHNPHIEWVQNDADIENARIVWAREIDQDRAAELIRRFPGRSVWLFQPDRRLQALVRYPVDSL